MVANPRRFRVSRNEEQDTRPTAAFGRAIAQEVLLEETAAKAQAGWHISAVRQEEVHRILVRGHWAVGVLRALEHTYQSSQGEELVLLGQGAAPRQGHEQSCHQLALLEAAHTRAGPGAVLENIDSMRLPLVVQKRVHVRGRSAGGQPENTS